MKLIQADRGTLTPPQQVVPAKPIKVVSQDYRIEQDLHDNPDNHVNPVKLPVEYPVAPPPPPPRPPRRYFSEVLNAFMEESNIRWGEIIGGLLIIGCSTALVVSLWAQISQIPVLKFLIFTTVTAILFGIGLYTEHRWKLPTTSRGILTIATLLVPLNFLAIAAVSSSNTSGALVIGSELVAPAIFLCLVYFAGRVITPGCAHVLSAGVLGSSVGQLLVRHFASLDAPPPLLIFLGAFPVLCYVVTVGLALRFVLTHREIDERETTTVFTMLGTMSFAALLPFGLLLYKSGPLAMSMMYLAPIVTLWGLPLVATGTTLWKRITNKELVASRTAGTALGILGLMIVLAGMILAWPNPSSIVPAALLNFAIFTVLAVALELPVAHVIAAICFALAYLVTFHVFFRQHDVGQSARHVAAPDDSFSYERAGTRRRICTFRRRFRMAVTSEKRARQCFVPRVCVSCRAGESRAHARLRNRVFGLSRALDRSWSLLAWRVLDRVAARAARVHVGWIRVDVICAGP